MNRVLPLLLMLTALAAAGEYYDESKNALFIELLGTAGLYSLNYDRVLVTIRDRHHLGVRAGLSLVPVDTLNVRLPLVLPVTVNYLMGPRAHKLEVGAGIVTRIQFDGDWTPQPSVFPAANLCYRYHNYENEFHFRIGFTPLFFDGFGPWFGLSLGRGF